VFASSPIDSAFERQLLRRATVSMLLLKKREIFQVMVPKIKRILKNTSLSFGVRISQLVHRLATEFESR
jgi:hypothetical protein